MGISLLAKLAVARHLTTASYGEVAVGLTVLTSAGIVVRLGLDKGIARNAPRYEGADRRGVLVSSYLLSLSVAIAVAAVLYLSAYPIASALGNTALGPVLSMFAVGIPAVPIMRLSVAATQAKGRSAPKVIVQNLASPLTRITLVIIAVLLGASAVEVAAAYTVSYWVTALLALTLAAKYTTLFDGTTDWRPKYLEMFTFSAPLMVSVGLIFVVGNTDRLMIQYFLTSSHVADYDVGYMIGQTMTITLGAFGFLFLPLVSEFHSENRWNDIERVYKLVTKWIAFITLPVYMLVVLYPNHVIRYTFGSRYVGGSVVLVIIGSTYFVRAAMGPNKELLSAIGETRYIMYTNAAVAVMNVLFNIVLIPTTGIVGAAMASFASFLILNIFYVARLYWDYGIQPFSKAILRPLGPFLSVAGFGYVVVNVLISQSVLVSVAFGIVSGTAYGICILRFGGIESEDIMLVNSAEDRFGLDLGSVKRVAQQFM